MTEQSTAERLAALERRRNDRQHGSRRRPAEASRVLAAGAGTAAVLTMVTAMTHADQAVQLVESPMVDPVVTAVPSTLNAPVTQSPDITEAVPTREPVIETITVARPVRAQVTNGRTSASR